MMSKNIKQRSLLGVLALWLLSSATSAETKLSCFWVADSQAWFWWVAITSYQCFENEIEIPSKINGSPVTEIGKWAFKNTVLTAVKLPSTLKQISESAFEDNIIDKIEIPEGVQQIQKAAFKNNNLKALKLPSTLKAIGDEAFYKNKLEKIAVPWRLDKVGESAFCENAWDNVIWVSDSLAWDWKKSCFKLIKASTIEDSYAWIETDFSAEITDKLWSGIKTDNPEVDELNSLLNELQDDSATDDTTSTQTWDELAIDEALDTIDSNTGDEEILADDELVDEELTGEVEWTEDEWTVETIDLSSSFPTFQFDPLTWASWVLSMFNWFLAIIAILAAIIKLIEVLTYIALWEVYKKAWKRGWAFLVPIYNTVVYTEIAEKNKWLWLIPWLIPLAALVLIYLNVWALITGAVVWGLILISIIISIILNYAVARRFGWGVFPSILHVLFTPITTIFLWLRNDEYQPKKLTYDLTKPQVNEPVNTAPAPVVAAEQLNNVVEHFVGPEEVESTATTSNVETTSEETTNNQSSTTENQTLENSTEETSSEETTVEEKDQEASSLLEDSTSQTTLDAFDNMDSFKDSRPTNGDFVSPFTPESSESNEESTQESSQEVNLTVGEGYESADASTDVAEVDLTIKDQSDMGQNEETSDVDLTMNDPTYAHDENKPSDTPDIDLSLNWESENQTEENSEIDLSLNWNDISDNSEDLPDVNLSIDDNTVEVEADSSSLTTNDEETTIEVQWDESNTNEVHLDSESENTQQVSEEPEVEQNAGISTSDNENASSEVSAVDSEETKEQSEETPATEQETQGMQIDASFMEDMPQDTLEELYNDEKKIEGEEVAASNEEEQNQSDEPISDLDQLLANNKNA